MLPPAQVTCCAAQPGVMQYLSHVLYMASDVTFFRGSVCHSNTCTREYRSVNHSRTLLYSKSIHPKRGKPYTYIALHSKNSHPKRGKQTKKKKVGRVMLQRRENGSDPNLDRPSHAALNINNSSTGTAGRLRRQTSLMHTASKGVNGKVTLRMLLESGHLLELPREVGLNMRIAMEYCTRGALAGYLRTRRLQAPRCQPARSAFPIHLSLTA